MNKPQAKAKKEKQSKKQKTRNGKSLFNDDSGESNEAQLVSESDQEHSSEKKSSGIRTISVREWLRRG